MGQTKRERKSRKFNFNVNRKKLNRNRKKTGTAAAAVPIVKKAWEESKTIRENLVNMGLAYDSNVAVKIPTAKERLKSLVSEETPQNNTSCPSKSHVAEELEANANAPRVKSFQLPSGQVLYLTYLMDKYGVNFKAMARDNKNIYQETWKQIRNKIRTFQKIPSQWNAYLAHRAELENPGKGKEEDPINDEVGIPSNDEVEIPSNDEVENPGMND